MEINLTVCTLKQMIQNLVHRLMAACTYLLHRQQLLVERNVCMVCSIVFISQHFAYELWRSYCILFTCTGNSTVVIIVLTTAAESSSTEWQNNSHTQWLVELARSIIYFEQLPNKYASWHLQWINRQKPPCITILAACCCLLDIMTWAEDVSVLGW